MTEHGDPTREGVEPIDPRDTQFRLTRNDTANAVWVKLAKHYEAKLASLRIRNDNTALDAVRTAELRGEIRAVKNLLALAQPAPAVGEANPDEGE